jgi:hypothetical protein
MEFLTLGAVIGASAFLVISAVMLFASARLNRGAGMNTGWVLMALGLLVSGAALAAYEFAPADFAAISAVVGAVGTLLVLIGSIVLRRWMKKLNA